MMNTILTQEQIGQVIIDEAIRTSKKYSGKSYHIDITEMESWLITEIYTALNKYPHMSNPIGIRHIAKKRAVNYIRDIARHNVVVSYDNEQNNEEQSDFSDDTFNVKEFNLLKTIDPQDKFVEKEIMKQFLKTLPVIEKRVLELTVGLTRSLDRVQIARVKELIDRKAICQCGVDGCQHNVSVWFTATDVGNVLELTRRQVQYILGKMKDKALDFGLEM